jgi:hypothetical protein
MANYAICHKSADTALHSLALRSFLSSLALQLVGAQGSASTYQTVALGLYWSVDGRVEQPDANPCPSII